MAAFFDDVVPLLKGQMDVDCFLARQGESPSANARFQFYVRLMRRNIHRVMEALFPQIKVALDEDEPGAFAALVDAYNRAHPPSGWDLNQVGAGFSAFLEEQADLVRAKPYVPEAADWAFARFSIGSAHPAEFPGLCLPATVREYRFDVPAWHGGAPPAPTPLAVLLYRTQDDRVCYRRVSREELIALADAQGLLDEICLPAALLERGRERLRALSILPARDG